MSETDHIHKQGALNMAPPGDSTYYQCSRFPKSCDLIAPEDWWDAYEEAIADVQKHGLPDHRKRVAEAVADVSAFAVTKSSARQQGIIARQAIRVYHAWTKEEPEA